MLTLEVSACVCVCERVNIVTQQDLHNQRKTGHIAKPVLKLRGEVHTFLTDHKQPRNVLNLGWLRRSSGFHRVYFGWQVEHTGPL